jgi:hypothetical protein
VKEGKDTLQRGMAIAGFRHRDGVKEYTDPKNDDGIRGWVKASAATAWLLEEFLV